MAQSKPVERYRIPAGQAQSEIVIKNSVFIGTVGHAASVDAAQAFITQVRATYADANHNAWAFRITEGAQALIGSSDDGEPGGTAGRPMLAMLEGSGLLEVVVVGTRYFGGIKLGTGGLVRAYGAAARKALEQVATIERVLHYLAEITVDYGLYGNLRYLLPQHQVKIEQERFAERVMLQLLVPYDQTEAVADLLRELTNGQILLDRLWAGERYETATGKS